MALKGAQRITEAQSAINKHRANITARLNNLKASATQQYSLKNYAAAAEFYSEAAELQDELNGEMSTENADLLYTYGRCLYHVAVSQSDVLGGKVAAGEEPKRKKRKVQPESSAATGADETDALKTGEERLAEDVVEAAVEEKDGMKSEQQAAKPYFQITGDENWTDSEEDEAEDGADGEAEEQDDDFAVAFEILDVARVLLRRKLEELQTARAGDGKGKAVAVDDAEARQVKERLADTHDLQAEISLENERFQDAIQDTRDALSLKIELYPQESSLIAEAHFKLSLALEFSSVTSSKAEDAPEDSADAAATETQVDEEMRKEAAAEMEKAIESCRLRVSKEEESLASLDATKAEEKKKSIADVKEMITDMKNRLVELRNPAVSLSGINGPAGAHDDSNPLAGVLGQMLGETPAQQKKRLEDATKGANDLSGLVKHKKKASAKSTEPVEGNGKRKLEDGEGAEGNGKKVKFEDGGA